MYFVMIVVVRCGMFLFGLIFVFWMVVWNWLVGVIDLYIGFVGFW